MKIEQAIKSENMPLMTKTVINVIYTSRYIEELTAAVLKERDLSSQQYNVLRILKGQNGKPANLNTIQERMIDASSNTSRLVDKLIKKGFVERRICPANRRKVEILITAEGLKLLDELYPTMMEINTKSIKSLTTEEQELLNNLLDKLRNDE